MEPEGFGSWGSESRAFRVQDLVFEGLGREVRGFGLKVFDLGCRVWCTVPRKEHNKSDSLDCIGEGQALVTE